MSIYRKWNKSSQTQDWYIDYRFHGRRIRERIGPNKALAQTVLRKRLVEVAEGRFLAKPQEIRTTLAEMATLYMENHAKPAKRSWWRDGLILKSLIKHFGDVRLTEITALKIEAYRAERKLHVKDSTINRETAVLKCLYNKAIAWGKATDNPVKRVKQFKENNTRTRFLEKGEIDALLKVCPDWVRPIVLVALHTGMRKGEILNLAWDDIDFKNGLIRVRDSKSKEGRIIDMSAPLTQTLKALPKDADSPYVFPGKRGQLAKVRGRIRSQFTAALSQVGIKDFRFHDLRHTFASHLAMHGVDLFTIGAFLGHKSGYRMTQRYAHLSPQHRQKAIHALDGLTQAIQPRRTPQPGSTSQMDTHMDTWAETNVFEHAEQFGKLQVNSAQSSHRVGWQSGQMHWSVKPAGYALRRFESCPNHTLF